MDATVPDHMTVAEIKRRGDEVIDRCEGFPAAMDALVGGVVQSCRMTGKPETATLQLSADYSIVVTAQP